MHFSTLVYFAREEKHCCTKRSRCDKSSLMRLAYVHQSENLNLCNASLPTTLQCSTFSQVADFFRVQREAMRKAPMITVIWLRAQRAQLFSRASGDFCPAVCRWTQGSGWGNATMQHMWDCMIESETIVAHENGYNLNIPEHIICEQVCVPTTDGNLKIPFFIAYPDQSLKEVGWIILILDWSGPIWTLPLAAL